ncbi:Chromosome partitioning ATPase in PFGI-1-like cluster, ParA-like [Cronobacter sakazakii 696]|nr:Chromosome partitioning ATPase in PFGI-1-like cluster, ParA-like [Cronobacter sakazakii 696]
MMSELIILASTGTMVGIAKPILPDVREFMLKWFTEFGHLNRGDMLTSEQHRCHNEKKKFQRRV